MAKTEDIEAKLAAYIDGDIDEAGRAEIEKHLAGNAQHRRLIEQLKKHREILRSLPHEPAPLEVSEAINAQLERAVLLGDIDSEAEASSMRIGPWHQVRGIAAVLLLTVSLAAVIAVLLRSPNQQTTLADLPENALPQVALDRTAEADNPAMPEPVSESAVRTAAKGGADDAFAGTGGPASLDTANGNLEVAEDTDTASEVRRLGSATEGIAMDARTLTNADAMKAASGDNGMGRGMFDEIFSNATDPTLRVYSDALTENEAAAIEPDGSDSYVYVIPTDNPELTSLEVTRLLTRNNFNWEPVAEGAPAPIEVSQKAILPSREQQLSVQIKGGNVADAGGAGAPGAAQVDRETSIAMANQQAQAFDPDAQYSLEPPTEQQSPDAAVAQAQQRAPEQVASAGGGRGGRGGRGARAAGAGRGGGGGGFTSQVAVPAAGFNSVEPPAPEQIVARQLTREQATGLKEALDELSRRTRNLSPANGPNDALTMTNPDQAGQISNFMRGGPGVEPLASGLSGGNVMQGELDARDALNGNGAQRARQEAAGQDAAGQRRNEAASHAFGLEPLTWDFIGFKALPALGIPATQPAGGEAYRYELFRPLPTARTDFLIVLQPEAAANAVPSTQPMQGSPGAAEPRTAQPPPEAEPTP